MTRTIPWGFAAILFAWLAMLPASALSQPSTITSGSNEYVIRIRNGSGEPTEMSVSYWSGMKFDSWRSSGPQLVPPGGYFVHAVRNASIGKDPNGRNRIWYVTLWETFSQSRSSRNTNYTNLEWRVTEGTQYYPNGNWVTTATLDLDVLRTENIVATVRNQTARSVAINDNGATTMLAPSQALTIPLAGLSGRTVWYGCKCGKWHPLTLGKREIRLRENSGDTHTMYDE